VPESLLTILKFVLVGLVWLFFLWVLRAAWAELRPTRRQQHRADKARAGPEPRRPPPPEAGRLRLRVVEPASQRGHSFDLGGELTVGRAPGCGVRLDDGFASKLHARVFSRDGQLWVEDLGSTNGTFVNSQRISSPTRLSRGDRLRIGQTVLEVSR
jgi:hypothetical protein